MAVRTLKAKYEAKDDSISRVRHVFCPSKGQKGRAQSLPFRFLLELGPSRRCPHVLRYPLRPPHHYREITARCIAIMNRADPDLIKFMEFMVNRCDPPRARLMQPERSLIKNFWITAAVSLVSRRCTRMVSRLFRKYVHRLIYSPVTFPTAPHMLRRWRVPAISPVRLTFRRSKMMSSSSRTSSNSSLRLVRNRRIVSKLFMTAWSVCCGRLPTTFHALVSPEAVVSFLFPIFTPSISIITSVSADKIPLLHLKRRLGTQWEYSSNLTGVYFDILHEIATSGTTIKDKNTLIIGVGKGSIGVEILKGLLVPMLLSPPPAIIAPQLNTKQDVETLVDYIYMTLGLDLDYVIPFAAVPDNGREIDGLDDKSELAHRIMLVNLLRLLGAIKTKKASRQIVTRPDASCPPTIAQSWSVWQRWSLFRI
jgi:fatty acid synthase subunit alpha, fungi type